MNTAALPEEQLEELIERPKIVLIDDDADQLRVLSYRLEQQGFHTFSAMSGQVGFELVRRQLPDLVVMDLGLPDSSGFEICKNITDDPKLCNIPVIIVSGMERSDVVRETRSAGATFYVRKPYDPNALLLLVHKAINDAKSW